MTSDLSKPFYLSVQNHTSDKCPSDKNKVIADLNKAIEATNRSIDLNKKKGFDTSEFDLHLKNLKAWLKRVGG